jgi:Lon protease-like protein
MMNRLPLFPLNTVLFPGGLLPLKVFEPRYLDLVSDCMRNNTGFGICLISDGEEAGAPATVRDIGTMVNIIDWDRRSDGLLGILVHGEQRFRVRSTTTEKNGLVMADVEYLPFEPHSVIPEEFRSMSEMLARIMKEIGAPYDRLEVHYDLADEVCARLTELLPLEMDIKQQILEMDDPLSRLFTLRDAMRDIKMAS